MYYLLRVVTNLQSHLVPLLLSFNDPECCDDYCRLFTDSVQCSHQDEPYLFLHLMGDHFHIFKIGFQHNLVVGRLVRQSVKLVQQIIP